MRGWNQLSRNDLAIRAAGLLLLFGGIAAGRQLGILETVAVHRGWALPMLVGAAAYLGCTLGSLLACLGAHTQDSIRVTSPWR